MMHAIFNILIVFLTCMGSLCMNLGGAWKKYGVLMGTANGPLWLLMELHAGNQQGMFLSSLLIWGTYFVGLWKCRHELLVMFCFAKPAMGGFITIDARGGDPDLIRNYLRDYRVRPARHADDTN
jgi:hypothetical protein